MFKPSAGLWLISCGILYFVVALADHFYFQSGYQIVIQLCWFALVALPLVVPRLADKLNMYTIWEKTGMWRKREIADKVNADMKDDNIVQFPEVKAIPMPKVVDPSLDSREPSYTIGVNDAGNTSFRLKLDYGSVSLTMTQQGVIDLIEDLAHTIRKDYSVDIVPVVDEDNTPVH